MSFLYSYTPRPNTALYVGYNDLLFNGLDPLDGKTLARALIIFGSTILFSVIALLFSKVKFSDWNVTISNVSTSRPCTIDSCGKAHSLA